MYKAIYHPYGKHDEINTRQAIDGVPYLRDVGSAAKSAIVRGIPPEVINRDMGIVDIRIESKVDKKSGKAIPIMTFTPDRYQMTRHNMSNKRARSKRNTRPTITQMR